MTQILAICCALCRISAAQYFKISNFCREQNNNLFVFLFCRLVFLYFFLKIISSFVALLCKESQSPIIPHFLHFQPLEPFSTCWFEDQADFKLEKPSIVPPSLQLSSFATPPMRLESGCRESHHESHKLEKENSFLFEPTATLGRFFKKSVNGLSFKIRSAG